MHDSSINHGQFSKEIYMNTLVAMSWKGGSYCAPNKTLNCSFNVLYITKDYYFF